MKLNFLYVLFFGHFFFGANAQEISRKTYQAVRTIKKPTIDGRPIESVWSKAEEATNFTVLQPDNGESAPTDKSTVIKILYDDNAIYVAGYLYDSKLDQIAKQFSQRDQIDVQVDLFSIWINTYNNQIDQTRFYVTAAGAIGDSKAINGNEDFSYEVVFDAKVNFDEKGWYVEMEIPYQALRFPEAEKQDWSFNILRRINNDNLSLTYNYIDVSQGNEAQYDANLIGIENIEPPLRLSLFPYASTQFDDFQGERDSRYSAGMDVKYGISDAFTLDATLIPDFGQVGFDELELNLGPFEQVFQERRPFFTEGIELFEKGNIFFSRRIGDTPSGFDNVKNSKMENEIILENPDQSQLINAVKITGRTKEKLGIGFLNAITAKTEATIKDTISLNERTVITEPLTNYNLFVLDQQFASNSSVYLTNASTLRNGSFADANVTAAGLVHFDKSNKYRYSSDVKVSNKFSQDSTDTGISLSASARKVEGKWRYGISHLYRGKNYDPNDLGLNFVNNQNSTYSFLSFNQFTPKGKFNNYSFLLGVDHVRCNMPAQHLVTFVNLNPNFQTKNLYSGGGFVTFATRELDIFESRISDLPVLYKPRIIYGSYLTTDTRKRFSVGFNVNSEQRFNDSESRVDFSVRPAFRLTDRLFFQYSIFWQKRWNRLSFVTVENNNSILSRRYTRTIENSLQAVYNIDVTKAVNLRLRNFWSAAEFSKDFKQLQDDGGVTDYTSPNEFQPDVDFNIWNLDLSFIWRFAPASDLTFLYRNSLSSVESLSSYTFTDSLNNLFNQPLNQTVSVRLTYFLDVNKVFK